MLVLTRKLDEKIRIGENIEITVLRIRNNQIRLGISAPRDVRVLRGELETVDTQVTVDLDLDSEAARALLSQAEPAMSAESGGSAAPVNPMGDATPTPEPGRNRVRKFLSDADSASVDSHNRCNQTLNVFTGKIDPSTGATQMRRAPLGGFFTAP